MRHVIVALVFVLLTATARAEMSYRIGLPSILHDQPVIMQALGPCSADLDCIQGYP